MANDKFDKIKLELRRGILVLAVLQSLQQPHYGYSLRKQLNEAGLDIDEGTLYPLIRRLAEQGLLESEWQQAEQRKRRYYQLSDEGRSVLQLLITEWQQLNTTLQALMETSHESH
ncbi:PadR family transcriptional regulator [Pseudidiomarina sp.]|uniref:PadR family transcriptional regulator n=1 Tax=Pseudidiomarina sp. TaxID=2081707 RepID=UPI00299EFF2C|nr:PadR family transcriptional regulator [Pseudidiomarina sp.]MDX1705679.1 PadR family transcriptional regulator [Pseudidiomarina sp.]